MPVSHVSQTAARTDRHPDRIERYALERGRDMKKAIISRGAEWQKNNL
jgi:hypothetical protein